MNPITFEQVNVTLAKNQPEYRQLPVLWDDESGTVTSCWKLSFRERIKLLFTGKLWLQMMNFGKPPSPIYPTVNVQEVIMIDVWKKMQEE
jgi:hypothetical protein